MKDFVRKDGLNANKVNIIGSLLYGAPREVASNTSWLMDELNSYWMVEFIQQIIKEFEGVFSDKTVQIVIDNSPGFSCFIQALHGFMYEKGPSDCKFLLVSTLDSQDLQSNIDAAREICASIDNRVMAAKYFK